MLSLKVMLITVLEMGRYILPQPWAHQVVGRQGPGHIADWPLPSQKHILRSQPVGQYVFKTLAV